MKLKRFGDLITDEYGNYYHVVAIDGHQITLANAFMELCYRRKLDDLYIEEHKGEYVGTHAMNIIKSVIERAERKKTTLKIVPLDEVKKHYEVQMEPLFERD
ncbi:MAG TPA: hypothetical protein VFK44_02585 [Bacillales bacterium]|nr:hypothetical protein [Bacillales bacterium]